MLIRKPRAASMGKREGAARRRAIGMESLERRLLLASDLLSDTGDSTMMLSLSASNREDLKRAVYNSQIEESGDRKSYRNLSLTADRADVEGSARALLQIIEPNTEFELVQVRHGIASSHAQFQQIVDGIRVHGSAASIHLGPDGVVQTLHVDTNSEFESFETGAPAVSFAEASTIASTANRLVAPVGQPQGELVWYPTEHRGTVLAWESTVTSVDPVGEFQTIVDASTGKVLSQRNLAVFDSGTGDVFYPNPYQTQGSGSGMTDNNDATSSALDAQLTTVTLQRLDPGTGLIKGEWVDLSTLNSPTLPDIDADEPTRVYQYDRDDPRFEQVVIYHTIDSVQAYIHSLGFDDDVGIANGIRDFPTLANAHWNDEDQSFYSTGNDAVHFGDGGVDDGEDGDIIVHEYGHAIQHDQNPLWGGAEMDAMGEGFGDYLAASFFAAEGDAAFQSSHAACVGEWDATSYSGSNPPCLRRVDGNKIYPDDLIGSVHADGEIWSAALWDIRAAIGATTTDQLVLEHHFALPPDATMPEAANEMLNADANLNGGANQAAILQAFIDRGILANDSSGMVTFDAAVYSVGDPITITVSDADLVGGGPISVTVASSGGDNESVTLTENVNGDFVGTLPSTGNVVSPASGELDGAAGDTFTVTYNDADDGSGVPAVVTDTATFTSLITLFEADFSDDFGNPIDEGFTLSGPSNQWHLSTGRGNDAGHTSDDSFYFGSGEGSDGGGQHGDDRDGTLLSPIIDLTGAATAELSFSHFLQSESGFDFASVSVVSGSSTTVIATSEFGSLPTETFGFVTETIDVSAFVGQSIQFAFRFTSDDSVTNEGWYVDDVKVRVSESATPLEEVFVADFSDALGAPSDESFTLSGPANLWHLSTGRGNDGGHSPVDSFYFGEFEDIEGGGAYDNDTDGTITSPLIDLTNSTVAVLSLNHFLTSEEGFDFATISVIHGSETTVIATSENGSLPVATAGFEGVSFSLTPFVGQPIQVAFRFTSDESVIAEGWYVDDVVVRANSTADPIPENTGQWVNQGPIGANHRFLENLEPGNSIGGATHTVLAHPTDPDILYIGTVNGGIWKTTNASDPLPIWVNQTDFLDSQSIGAMAFDPGDPTFNTLVAVTARYSSFGGVGGDRGAIYRTTDGGATWIDPGSVGLFGENLSGVAVRGDTIVATSSAFGGGVLRSTDGGISFVALNDADFVDNDNFSDLVEDPTNPNRLYAANSAGGPGGIYRSDDFGANWTKITGTTINAEMEDLLVASNNIEMAVSPTTGRLYVAILLSSQPEAIYHTNTASTSSPSWTRMDIPVLPQGDGVAITGATNASPIVITSPGHGLTNPSRGVNFVVIDGVTGNTAANGFHRVNVINSNTFELTGTTGNGVYSGGGTWTKVAGPNPTPKNEPEAGAQGRTHFSIVVDPTDENIVYLGGDRQDSPNRIGAVNISGAIFRGDTRLPSNPNVAPSPQWDHLTNDIVDFDPSGGTATGSAPHADSREMVFDALGNLIEVDDGGVYKRTSPRDNTGDWFSLIGNLSATEFHDVAYDSVSGTIIGGLQDNGTLFQPASGSTFWNILSGGDGGDVAVDDVSLAGSGQSIRYTSFQNLGSFRKTIWDEAGNLVSQTFPSLSINSGASFSPFFNTPIALNHVDPNRLLFGMANGLYESSDQGESLDQIASIIATASTAGNAMDYGGRSGGIPNADVIYVGDRSGDVHVRTSSFGSFSTTNPSGGSTEDIVDVIMDPDRWETAFAIDANQVFQTTDSGGAWSDITGNLGSLGASVFRSLQYVSGTVEALVVGSNRGIFASLASSLGTWFPLGTDLPNVPVFDLDYDASDDVLVAGTMGRGVWLLDDVSQRLLTTPEVATITLDGSGNLVIGDSTGNQSDDLMIQSDVAGNQFVVTAFDQTLSTTLPGATGDGTDTVTIPFSVVTGSNVLIQTLGGRDRVTVDLTLGDFATAIEYDGGGPASGRGDLLRLQGGTVASAVYTATGADSGTIDLTGNGTITYTGLEPVESNVVAGDVTFNFTDVSETITVTPFGDALDQVHVASSAAENVSVPIPTGTLTINGGSIGFDTINVLGAFDLRGGGVALSGDLINLDGAALLTSGSGSISLLADRNLILDNNSRLRTVDGDITLAGGDLTTPSTGQFNGVFIDRTRILTVNGDIDIKGRGGDRPGGSFNRGVYLTDQTRIESSGTGANAGTITLEGVGGAAANGNRGVQLDSLGTTIRSVDGDITITGTGGDGTAGFNQGIILFEGLIESTGTGVDAAKISLNGTGGDGTEANVGIFQSGSSEIRSVDGAVEINGIADGSTNFNTGVVFTGDSRVRSLGTGSTAAQITINGTGGDANQSNRGVQWSGNDPVLEVVDGDLLVNGQGGNGTSGFNNGIIFFSGSVRSTGQGDLAFVGVANGNGGNGLSMQGGASIASSSVGDTTITATRSGNSSDVFVSTNGGATLGDASGTGDLAVIADTVSLDGVITVQGGGDLTIRPRSAAASIGIGGGVGTLNLNDTEISRFADGFNRITIGDAALGTGPVDVNSANFVDPVHIVGGSIDVAVLNAGSNAVSLDARTGSITDSSAATDVTGGLVTLTGDLAPGQSPGIFAVDGDVLLRENDTFSVEFGGTSPGTSFNSHDQLSVDGTVSIGSDVALNTAPFAGFTAAAGQSFLIIDNDASDPISGTFAGLPEGAPINDFLGSGLSAVITYEGGDGNDVVLTVAGLDYGDAPETYGTLLTNNGARHEPVGPRLGEGRDTELDGQPSTNSEGDDNLGDDEDGVMFGSIRVGDPMAGINIDLQNAATALVDAWVDFDGNGVFDTTDQILASAPVSSGLQTLNFNVPAGAILGLTAARVRVSTAGGLTPLGLAEDGEVEDYQVAIIPAGPEVESVVINGGEAQRSIVTELTVTFDREVTAPAAAFAITEIGTSTTVSNLNVNTSTVAGKTVAVLTFDPGTAVLTRANGLHSLIDGDFRLDITASQVTEVGGGANMAADYVFGDSAVDNFFRKYGDDNGNNLVELFDFAAFRGTFGLASTDPNFNHALDNDGNNQVDLFDFAAFRGNFGS